MEVVLSRSARSASSASSCATTSCSSGSWTLMACPVSDAGSQTSHFTQRPAPRTASGCCSRKRSGNRGGGACSRLLTSRWTAGCATPGPRTRAIDCAAGNRRKMVGAAGATGSTKPVRTGADLQGRASQSRDLRLDHRPGGSALPQGQAAMRAALLSRPCAQREPERPGGRYGADRGRPLVKSGAGGYAERNAALSMLEHSSLPRT